MELKKRLTLLFYQLRYKFQAYKVLFQKYYADWKEKGKERLTIMIIPHNERKTVNFEISYKSITIFIGVIVLMMGISAINVLSHSGSVHELTELNLSNQDFIAQSKKMREEVGNLHGSIDYYYEKISDLYIKMGGNPGKISKGLGGLEKSTPAIENEEINNTNEQDKTDIPLETFKLKEDVYKMKLTSELTNDIITMLKKRKSVIKHTPSIWPIKGYILNPFGESISSLTGRKEVNHGVDISGFPGSEIYATAPGEIYETGFDESIGYYVKVAHKYTWKTIYSNLDRLAVQKNQKISKGDVIGYLGKTVGSPVYYLHYEIHVGTQAINPISFLNQIHQ